MLTHAQPLPPTLGLWDMEKRREGVGEKNRGTDSEALALRAWGQQVQIQVRVLTATCQLWGLRRVTPPTLNLSFLFCSGANDDRDPARYCKPSTPSTVPDSWEMPRKRQLLPSLLVVIGICNNLPGPDLTLVMQHQSY